MTRTLFFLLLLTLPVLASAQVQPRHQGTITRMRTTDCLGQHSFMATMSGGAKMDSGLLCPEYILLAENVVYVIVGKTSGQLLPLAEVTRFRLQKNEMLIRVDDAAKESHFQIRAMVLRPEWERNQLLEEAEANATISRHFDPATR